MNIVKKLRKELGMTQKELAARCSCAESSISEIENGTFRPNIDLADRIAKNLNSTIFHVFFSIG